MQGRQHDAPDEMPDSRAHPEHGQHPPDQRVLKPQISKPAKTIPATAGGSKAADSHCTCIVGYGALLHAEQRLAAGHHVAPLRKNGVIGTMPISISGCPEAPDGGDARRNPLVRPWCASPPARAR